MFSILDLQPAPKQSRDKSEAHKEKFLQVHYKKIESIKNLIGDFPQPGEAYFLFTLKSFNAFTFIVYIIKHIGVVDELTFSTYSLNERILASLIKWYDKGEIKAINLAISDSIRHRMPKVYDQIKVYSKDRKFNVRYCWNHSKITLIRSGDHHFVIEGSGNFSENAMHEQYLFYNSRATFDFRRECIMSYTEQDEHDNFEE